MEMVTDETLIAKAAGTIKFRQISPQVDVGSVACALVTDQGDVFIGINIDAKCSLGFCAEHNAIGAMLTHGQNKVRTIVAVNSRGQILPPCGRCRELMYQLDDSGATRIILKDRVALLGDLLPDFWVRSKYQSSG
jgi:cytidine deaminase